MHCSSIRRGPPFDASSSKLSHERLRVRSMPHANYDDVSRPGTCMLTTEHPRLVGWLHLCSWRSHLAEIMRLPHCFLASLCRARHMWERLVRRMPGLYAKCPLFMWGAGVSRFIGGSVLRWRVFPDMMVLARFMHLFDRSASRHVAEVICSNSKPHLAGEEERWARRYARKLVHGTRRGKNNAQILAATEGRTHLALERGGRPATMSVADGR